MGERTGTFFGVSIKIADLLRNGTVQGKLQKAPRVFIARHEATLRRHSIQTDGKGGEIEIPQQRM